MRVQFIVKFLRIIWRAYSNYIVPWSTLSCGPLFLFFFFQEWWKYYGLKKKKKWKAFCHISQQNYSRCMLKKDIMLTKHKFYAFPQIKILKCLILWILIIAPVRSWFCSSYETCGMHSVLSEQSKHFIYSSASWLWDLFRIWTLEVTVL